VEFLLILAPRDASPSRLAGAVVSKIILKNFKMFQCHGTTSEMKYNVLAAKHFHLISDVVPRQNKTLKRFLKFFTNDFVSFYGGITR